MKFVSIGEHRFRAYKLFLWRVHFPLDFIVAPSRALSSMSMPKVNAVRVWRRRVRSRHHGIGTWVETKLSSIVKHETTACIFGIRDSHDWRYHCRFQIITSSKSSNHSLCDANKYVSFSRQVLFKFIRHYLSWFKTLEIYIGIFIKRDRIKCIFPRRPLLVRCR